MTIEQIVPLAASLVNIGFLVIAFWKFPFETGKTTAETAKEWLDTYETMREAGLKRDEEIAKLRSELLDLQLVSKENEKLRAEVTELRETLRQEREEHNRELAELRAEIEVLRKQMDSMTVQNA